MQPRGPKVVAAQVWRLLNDGRTRSLASKFSTQWIHVRIGACGFAFEKDDPIGRLRDKALGGLAVETKGKRKDGTEFDGIAGLRVYLLAQKKCDVVRLLPERLLGYASGRAALLGPAVPDERAAERTESEGRTIAAGPVIVKSPLFRTVRGSEFGERPTIDTKGSEGKQ